MSEDYATLKKQLDEIKNALDELIDVVSKGFIATGDKIQELENALKTQER